MEEIELFLLKRNGSKMSYRPKLDCKEILIGNSPNCPIRISREKILPYHCKISINNLNQVIITNFSKESPPKVNDEQVPEHRVLKIGDIINILGTKLEFQLNGPLQKASMSVEKNFKSKSVFNPTKRITIHSIGSSNEQEKEQTPVKTEKLTTPKKETPQDKEETPFSTPVGDEKENTSSKINLLNMSGTLITSYTPAPKVPLTSRLSQTCSPRTRKIHDFSINYSSVESIEGTPDKVLPKKSMFLIDLSTPAPSKSSPRTPARKVLNVSNQTATSASSRSTPASTLKRKTPGTPGTPKSAATSNYYTPKTTEKPMSLRTNTLLKSALKNSAIKKTPARTDIVSTPKSSKDSGSLKSTPTLSSQTSEYTNDSIICINDSISSAASACSSVITVDDTIIEQSPVVNTTQNESLKISKGPRTLFSTPGKVSPSDYSDLEGVKELLATPEVIAKPPKEILIVKTPVKQVIPSNYSDLEGVKELLATPEVIVKAPKEVSIVESPVQQVIPDEPESQNQVEVEAEEDKNESHVSNKLNETYDIHSTSTEPGDESNLGSTIADEQQQQQVPEVNVINGLENQPDLVDHHLTDNEVEKKKLDLLKWMEEAKTKLNKNEIFEGNQVQQVVSTRYSNVTPNDSMTMTPEPVNIDTAKVSILEIEILKRRSSGSFGNPHLTVSPVSRLSVSEESEIFANYKLGTPQNLNNEIPKSLRSTRKRIGNALTYLHNTSNLQECGSDANDTLNASNLLLSVNGIEEETEVEEQHILSLDDQPKDVNEKEVEPVQEAFLNNYIEFVNKTSSDYEPEDEVVEVVFNDKIADSEDNENNDGSDDEEEFTGVEYLDDTVEEETDENTPKPAVEEKSPLFSDTEPSRVELNLTEFLNCEDNDQTIGKTENENVSKTEMEQELPPDFGNALSNGANDLQLLGENILQSEIDNSTKTPDDDNGNLNLTTTVPESEKIEITMPADLGKDNNIDEIVVTENVYEFNTSTSQSDQNETDKSVSILQLDETVNESIQETEKDELDKIAELIPAELPADVEIVPRKSIEPALEKNTAETVDIDLNEDELLCGSEQLGSEDLVLDEDTLLEEPPETTTTETKMSDDNIFGSDLGSQEHSVTESSDNKLSEDIPENPIVNENSNSIIEAPELNPVAIVENSEDSKTISVEEAIPVESVETSEDSKPIEMEEKPAIPVENVETSEDSKAIEMEEKPSPECVNDAEIPENIEVKTSEESAESSENLLDKNAESQLELQSTEIEDESLFESKSEESDIAEVNPCVASEEQPEIEEPANSTIPIPLENIVAEEESADMTSEQIEDNKIESENDEKPEEVTLEQPKEEGEKEIPEVGENSEEGVETVEESPKVENFATESEMPVLENDIKPTESELNEEEEIIQEVVDENLEIKDNTVNEEEPAEIPENNKSSEEITEENGKIDEVSNVDIPQSEVPEKESVKDDVIEDVASTEETVAESIPNSTNEEETKTEAAEDPNVTELEAENNAVSTEPEKDIETVVEQPEIEPQPEINETEEIESDVTDEVAPTVDKPIPVSTNDEKKPSEELEVEIVSEVNEPDNKETIIESTETKSEELEKSEEVEETKESEKPQETETEVPKTEEETPKPKTTRKRVLRGASEQKEQEPVKRGRRAVSVDPSRLEATNEESTTDASEEKRPTRNRPKKVPTDFVATPSRTRRIKTAQEPVKEIVEVPTEPEVVKESPEAVEEKSVEDKPEVIEAVEEPVAVAAPVQKTTRGRQKKIQDEILDTPKRTRQPRGQKVTQPIQSDEIASTSVDDDEKATVEKRTGRGGRSKKVAEIETHEEPESTITDKEQNNEESKEPIETVEEIAGPSNTTRRAGRIQNTTSKTENEETLHEEPDEKRSVRSRKKKIISDFVETPSRRGRKRVEQPETPAPEEKAPVEKVTRKRLVKKMDSEENQDETTNSLENTEEHAEEKPVKAKRGRKVTVTEEVSTTPLKRGRNATRARSEKTEETKEVEEAEPEAKEETKKMPARRGRNVKTVEEEEKTVKETPVKTTTRRGRHAAEEPTEQKAVEEKPRRGRKAKVVEEEEVPKATVKRGRHAEPSTSEATEEDEEEEVEKPTSRRGRHVERDAEKTVEEEEPPKTTTRRGRHAEPVATDKTVEEKPRRGRKVEKEVHEETSKVVEVVPAKPKRGRKPTVDLDPEPAEILPSPPKRGRRAKSSVKDNLTTSTPNMNSAALKSKNLEESHVEEVSHPRSLRTRKITEESSISDVVPPKRGRKKAETTVDHVEESVEKVIRSRRAASVAKSTSDSAKPSTTRSTRNNKK